MATSMFSGSGNTMAPSGRIDVETGSHSFEVAAAKPDVTVYISASMQDSKEFSTAKYMFSMMAKSMEGIAVYCDYVLPCATPEFKMAEN
jgi:hypothetical protein